MTPHPKRLEPLAVMAIAVLAAGTWACHSPTRPSPLPLPGDVTPPGAGTARAIRVVDGWTGQPVAGVQVAHGGETAVTNADGRTEVRLDCTRATFTVPRYLERSVRCLIETAADGRTAVTLWPIADAAESAATQAAVFINRRLTFPAGDRYMSFDVVEALRGTAAEAVWHRAAARIGELTAGRVTVPIRSPLGGGDGFVLIEPAAAPDCNLAAFGWSLTQAGFCWTRIPTEYFVGGIAATPATIGMDHVALRALLNAWGMRRHGLPGLLNEERPDVELSEFERKTIHMGSLRREVEWPDTEP
jgi:hypothetical protein